MPAGVHYDGDFSIAQPQGPPIPSAPFPTDPKLYLYKQRYMQTRSAFVQFPLDQAGPFGGVHVGESEFRDEGGGDIITWAREFATVPDRRSEPESFNYNYQLSLFTSGGSASVDIVEIPTTLSSRVQFDYFQTANPDLIELPRAPRLFAINVGSIHQLFYLNGMGQTVVYFRGNWNSGANYLFGDVVLSGGQYYFALADNTNDPPPSANWLQLQNVMIPGQEYLAEDSQLKIWKGHIYERRQRYVKWIDLASALSLPGR